MIWIGGVDVSDAMVDGVSNHSDRFLLVDVGFSFFQQRKPHRAKTQQGCLLSCSAKYTIIHIVLLAFNCTTTPRVGGTELSYHSPAGLGYNGLVINPYYS